MDNLDKDSLIEHIKHLRTIQFSLLLFCIIVLVTTYSQEISIKEKSILKDIEYINKFLSNYPDGRRWMLHNIALISYFDPIKIKIHRTNLNTKSDLKNDVFNLDVVRLNLPVIGKTWGVIENDDVILNLQSFRNFWMFAEEGVILFFNNGDNFKYIKENIKNAVLYSTPINDLNKISRPLDNTFREDVELEFFGEIKWGENRRRDEGENYLKESLKNPTINLVKYKADEIESNIMVLLEVDHSQDNAKSLVISDIPILPNPMKAGDLLVAEHFDYKGKWRPFERSFPYLAKLDKYYWDIPITELKNEFQDELKQKERTIEFMGLKIPEKILSQWSPFAILVIFIYFSIHYYRFKEISIEIRQKIHFPWIGLYRDHPSRLIHFTGLILLPGYTIFTVSNSIYWFVSYSISVVLLFWFSFGNELKSIAVMLNKKRSQ